MKKQAIDLQTQVVKNKDILTSEIDGEIVMLSIENSEYYGLDPVGSRIWKIIDEPISAEDIIGRMILEYDVLREQCESDVIGFLNDMFEKRVISITN